MRVGIVVPKHERTQNEVDLIATRISWIQNNCSHDFRLLEEPELEESLVPGVSKGRIATVHSSPTQLPLQCLKCSYAKTPTILETCPLCLGTMKDDERHLGWGSREQYFGNRYLYNSIQLSRCTAPDCSFVAASDIWDQ